MSLTLYNTLPGLLEDKDLARLIYHCALSTPFQPPCPVTLWAWEVLSMLCSYTLIPLYSCLSPWNAFSWKYTWLILEASIQTLLLESQSCLLQADGGALTTFPLHCVHNSRTLIIICIFQCLCLLVSNQTFQNNPNQGLSLTHCYVWYPVQP